MLGLKLQRSRSKRAMLQHSLFFTSRHFRRYGLSRKPKTADEKDANKAAVAQSLGAEEAEEEVRLCRTLFSTFSCPERVRSASSLFSHTPRLRTTFTPNIRTSPPWRRRALVI